MCPAVRCTQMVQEILRVERQGGCRHVRGGGAEARKGEVNNRGTARDPAGAVESAAGGAEAKELWALRKLCMLDHGQYYVGRW